MNRVLGVNVEDLDVTVEAGVTHRSLNKALASTGSISGLIPEPRDYRWHGCNGRVGDDNGALRTMRETVRGLIGAGRRPRDSNGWPRTQVIGRL